MSYIVMEFIENVGASVSEVITDKDKAEDERIYLQPDYENLLKVIELKD